MLRSNGYVALSEVNLNLFKWLSFTKWHIAVMWIMHDMQSVICICIYMYIYIYIYIYAEEHNLSPFDLNIACLCQSIEINNNKHVYRQSQVRKSTDSGAKWAECSMIIGTGCRVQVFLAWSSIAQSVCQRAFSLLANWCLGPRVQILHSAEEHNLSPFDLNIACLCQSIEINNNKHIYTYIYIPSDKWRNRSFIITPKRLPQFSSDLSDIWLECAQQFCPKSCGSRSLIILLLIFSMDFFMKLGLQAHCG